MQSRTKSFVVAMACLCLASGGSRWERAADWIRPEMSVWSTAAIEAESWRLLRRMAGQSDCVAWTTALRLDALQCELLKRQRDREVASRCCSVTDPALARGPGG